MSSPYPVLGDRPIDQWKVTELKEELKKRKLVTRGLKEDLIKRLDEALRNEREIAEEDADSDSNGDLQPEVQDGDTETVPDITKTDNNVMDLVENQKNKVDDDNARADMDDSTTEFGEGSVQDGKIGDDTDSARTEEVLVHTTTVETTTVKVSETAVFETEEAIEDSKPQLESEASKPQLESEDSKPQLESEDSKPQVENEILVPQQESVESAPQLENEISTSQQENEISMPQQENEISTSQQENEISMPQQENEISTPQQENDKNENSTHQQESKNSTPQQEEEDFKPQLEKEDFKPQLENEDSKPPHEDVMLDSFVPTNQVSEANPVLGFQVRSDSISTDSINEKNELKDNIIDDNVHLELDVVKPKMVEPSSSNVVPDDGESHPMDVDNKVSVEEKDDNNATNSDMSKKNDNADVGYSEKLNLDRSSGDDSMEEDASESKQIDSKYISDEVGDRSEQTEVLIVKEEIHVNVVGNDLSADKKDLLVENKKTAVPTEKRKLHDQEPVVNNEPVKRQRRWNTESVKVPERKNATITLPTTPKDTFQSPNLKRSFSRSNSAVSDDTPKERVVPPSPKTPTNSLRIDRFLRPFTLKAVQELLGKTGNVTSFWMDHIKTHCYVTYSSVEEAIETRNALYNLQWPTNGGRLLVAEFVDALEVKSRAEVPSQTPPAPVVNIQPLVTPTPQTAPSPRQPVVKQQPPPPQQQLPPPPPTVTLPPPPPLSNPPPVRERLALPPPPPLPEKVDPPIVTLDDLFRKTKATPRIYYLPLSEEQVAAKREAAARGKYTKQ